MFFSTKQRGIADDSGEGEEEHLKAKGGGREMAPNAARDFDGAGVRTKL